MIAAAGNVGRAEVAHAAEAVRVHDRNAADARVGNARFRDLKENAAKRVVDLFVVLVLALRETPEDRPEAELVKEIRGSERGGEWDLERDRRIGVIRNEDPACGEGRQLGVGVPGGANGR